MVDFSPAAPDDRLFRLVSRANDLYERHLYAEASDVYSRAIEFTPSDGTQFLAMVYANRCATRMRLKQWKDAKNDATKAIQLAPTWAKGHFRLADVMLHQQAFDDALDHYRKALDQDPSNATINARIGRTIIEQDNRQMGLTILQLIPGRDIAIDRTIRNPIQKRIYEFAEQMRNIIYVVADEDTKQCVLVDACWDLNGIIRIVEERGYVVVAAVVTHYHFDHIGGSLPPPYSSLPLKIGGLATLLKKFSHIKAYVHPDDIPYVRQSNASIAINRLVPTCTGLTETLEIGRTKIRFLHTPGHTLGSQALLINEARLIAGDTLLCGHCGRTDLRGGNRKRMEDTLRNVLGKLDDRIVVYPGHHYGSEWSTIGLEREKGCLGDDLVGFGMEKSRDADAESTESYPSSVWSKRYSI